MSRFLRNQLFESSLRAAGFLICYPEDANSDEWKERETMHHWLCALYEKDPRDMIQAGTNERTAAICTMEVLKDLAKTTLTGNCPVWILGPRAAYVARGYGNHLTILIQNEKARLAEASKDMIPS